jgi:SAM-dependent methyltransferase
MTSVQAFNQDQQARWNGTDGECWSREQERLDHMLAPILRALLDFAAPRVGSTVIDIGCGCGATTLELARKVRSAGRVVGIDISEPMLTRARERLSSYRNVTFRLGDAAVLPLGDLEADMAVSRFGVMFFGDPAAAFANLRKGLTAGGQLRFVCWRAIQENPWLQIPLHAVYEHAPRLPKPEPEEPGPFSFADTKRVTRILTASGFSSPSFTSLDVSMDLAAGGSLEDAVQHSTETGPARRTLEGQADEIRSSAMDSIRRALTPYVSAEAVKLPGGIWLVAANRID